MTSQKPPPEDIGTEPWLRERFPEKDWHRHPRTDGRTDLCDGTPSDCASRPRGEGKEKVTVPNLPEGMRWCPECNGEGEVWTMDATPDMDEHRHDCTYPGCAEGKGIVPVDGAEQVRFPNE